MTHSKQYVLLLVYTRSGGMCHQAAGTCRMLMLQNAVKTPLGRYNVIKVHTRLHNVTKVEILHMTLFNDCFPSVTL